jgi:hypothetical protein
MLKILIEVWERERERQRIGREERMWIAVECPRVPAYYVRTRARPFEKRAPTPTE